MTERLMRSSAVVLCMFFLLSCICCSARAEWFLQYDPDPSPTANQLRAVWGSSETSIFAVGEYGTILHTTDNGETWDNMTAGGSGIPQTIYGIWGSSATDVFAVADSGKIIHYNGTAWSSMTSTITSRLRDVWGFSASDVFIVGESGKILHYNGSAWSTMTSPTTLTLQGVWGISSTNVYAVGGPSAASPGNGARIIKYNGSVWTEILNSSEVERFHDVWGSDGDNVFVVGEGGAIVHTTDGGSTWNAMDNPVKDSTVILRDIWGNAANDIFAAGDGDATDYGSTILHYDGTTWTVMANPREVTTTKMHGIGGTSGSNVFAVGDRYVESDGITVHGTILHFINAQPNATFTVSPASGDSATVFQVDASGSTDDKNTLATLRFKWDWENDGIWDTGFSGNCTAEHQYASPGSYTIRLQVKDTDNLTDDATQTVTVAPPPTTTTSSISSGGGGGGGGSTPATTTSSVITTTTTSVEPTTTTTTSIQEPPPETTTTAVSSTTTTAPFCPLRNVLGDESGWELSTLRQYRDAVLLKTVPGIMYVSLYYIHGPEIIKIFAEHQELEKKCGLWVRDIAPQIAAGLETNTPVRLSAAQYRNIMGQIAGIRRHSSPALCKTLDAVAEMLSSRKSEQQFSVLIEKE